MRTLIKLASQLEMTHMKSDRDALLDQIGCDHQREFAGSAPLPLFQINDRAKGFLY